MPGSKAKQLIIASGLSGSGKSTALRSLEDLGYFCVDNLPGPLLSHFVDFLLHLPERYRLGPQPMASSDGRSPVSSDEAKVQAGPVEGSLNRRFALLVDCRDEESVVAVRDAMEQLAKAGVRTDLMFFECRDEVLSRRFQETRRPHPLLLSGDKSKTINDAISRERHLLTHLREHATRIIDTTSLSPHELRHVVEDFVGEHPRMKVVVSSFGFKYGVPHDADLVVDVRFLPNPHFIPGLREQTGLEAEVREAVFASGDAGEFLSQYTKFLGFVLPRYQEEGKRYLNVAVGCTGGRHRSVALAEKLSTQIKDDGFEVTVRHRDLAGAG